MGVAWPGRREDVLNALDILAAAPGSFQGGRARWPTLTDAVHWLVDDTFWDARDPAEDIGALLVDEDEAAAVRRVVAAVVAVSDRQGPTASDKAWFDDRGWPMVRNLAARAATAMRGYAGEAEVDAQEDFEVRPLGADEFEDYWRRAIPVGLPVLTIDGGQFDDFDGFVARFSGLLDEFEWRGSLDAFNDILRGGCGTPDGGFELRWLNSRRSREVLGWPATIGWFEDNLARCHPSNVPRLSAELEAARRGEGTTLFDWIVEIIERHGPGGSESVDNVVLRLS